MSVVGLDIGRGLERYADLMAQGYRDRAALEREQQQEALRMQQLAMADQRAREMQQESFQNQADILQKTQDFNLGLQKQKAADELRLAQLKAKNAKGMTVDPVTGEVVAASQPKPSQYAVAGYATRAQDADNIYRDLQKKGFDPGASSNRFYSSGVNIPFTNARISTPNEFISPEYQQADQAKRNFISAVLRKESGAAISREEFVNEDLKYFPQAGDSPEVIAQKARSRQGALAALSAEAGPALSQVQANFASRTKEQPTYAQGPQAPVAPPIAPPKALATDAELFADVQAAINRLGPNATPDKVQQIYNRALQMQQKALVR